MWSIWKARNKTLFDDGKMCPLSIIEDVRVLIHNLYTAHNLTLIKGACSNDMLQFLIFLGKKKAKLCRLFVGKDLLSIGSKSMWMVLVMESQGMLGLGECFGLMEVTFYLLLLSIWAITIQSLLRQKQYR